MAQMDVDEKAGPGPSSSNQAFQRAKGRAYNQLRPITCDRGILHRADGSARWTQEGASVLAAVYGPRQAGVRKEDAEKAVVEAPGFPS
eukprot:gene20429-27217_t